mmetsp:Transcript_77105/g.200895  ORF Transcript_77105/g.200895 Transcript_77105/m.200895 type:complete len:234 (-) Transcript_77105:27-728(-)
MSSIPPTAKTYTTTSMMTLVQIIGIRQLMRPCTSIHSVRNCLRSRTTLAKRKSLTIFSILTLSVTLLAPSSADVRLMSKFKPPERTRTTSKRIQLLSNASANPTAYTRKNSSHTYARRKMFSKTWSQVGRDSPFRLKVVSMPIVTAFIMTMKPNAKSKLGFATIEKTSRLLSSITPLEPTKKDSLLRSMWLNKLRAARSFISSSSRMSFNANSSSRDSLSIGRLAESLWALPR